MEFQDTPADPADYLPPPAPVTHVHLYRGIVDYDDGSDQYQQVLVTVWSDGTAEIAFRSDDSRRWGPPQRLEDWQHGEPRRLPDANA